MLHNSVSVCQWWRAEKDFKHQVRGVWYYQRLYVSNYNLYAVIIFIRIYFLWNERFFVLFVFLWRCFCIVFLFVLHAAANPLGEGGLLRFCWFGHFHMIFVLLSWVNRLCSWTVSFLSVLVLFIVDLPNLRKVFYFENWLDSLNRSSVWLPVWLNLLCTDWHPSSVKNTLSTYSREERRFWDGDRKWPMELQHEH